MCYCKLHASCPAVATLTKQKGGPNPLGIWVAGSVERPDFKTRFVRIPLMNLVWVARAFTLPPCSVLVNLFLKFNVFLKWLYFTFKKFGELSSFHVPWDHHVIFYYHIRGYHNVRYRHLVRCHWFKPGPFAPLGIASKGRLTSIQKASLVDV